MIPSIKDLLLSASFLIDTINIQVKMNKIFFSTFLLALILLSACGSISVQPQTYQSESGNMTEFDSVSISNTPMQTTTELAQTPLEKAGQLLFAGDFSNALNEFQLLYNQSTDSEIKAAALMGIGRTQYRSRNCTSAVDTFNRILGQYSSTKVIPEAYFFLGQCFTALQEYPQAVNAYEKYIQLRPGVIDQTVRENQAVAAEKAGDLYNAISYYQAALQVSTNTADKATLNLKIGQAYAKIQNFTTAIQIYQSVYDATEDAYTKASADLLMGQAFLDLGMQDEAKNRLLDAVIQFPRAYDSYTALRTLLLRGISVDDKLRGIVDYYAGDYTDAIQSFERYLSTNPSGEDGTTYYYKGLSHYFLNQPGFAIQAYDQLIQNYPGSKFWAAAWDEKAYVQWVQLEEYTNAANTLRTFVSQAPKTIEAPSYLFEAGRILERKGDLEGAIAIWRQLSDEYPSFERNYEAIFLSAIAYFRLNKFDESIATFQRNLILASSAEEKAAALLWIGKCYQAKNDQQNALSYWGQAEKLDPTGYYSIRAGQLINNKKPAVVNASYDLGYDLNFEKPEAESWLRTKFKITLDTDLSGLGDLAKDMRIQKAQELWNLDIWDQAVEIFETVQKENENNPLNNFRLMNYFYSLGLYRLAINSARNVLDLARLDDLSSLSAPIYFTHIRFGAYFRQQMMDAIKGENINPLVLYALIRQESLFDTTIISSAGARGLAQFMPATAKETSNLLGWPPAYSVEDLNRPLVAIRFAANYLNRLTTHVFNGDIFAGLAAYNAGPGNVQNWMALSKNDPDLFLEIIRFSETKTYLKHTIEFLNIYQLLYTH